MMDVDVAPAVQSCTAQEAEERIDVKQFEQDLKPPVVEYKKEEVLVSRLEAMASENEEGKCVEIRIMPEYMYVNNKPVKNRQLYGDKIYTHDSDIVAVLMHMGYFRMMDTTPIGMVTVKAIIRVLPDQAFYPSTLRNNLLSRSWNFYETDKKTCAYQVEGCWLVKRDGTLLGLKRKVHGVSDYLPTFVPAYSDRTVATRSTTATAERRQRNLPEQSFMFNLSNEICMKYSIFTVADRGLRPWQWTCSRFGDEVMYLETRKERFELARQNAKAGVGASDPKDCATSGDRFSFSKCLKILPQPVMDSIGIPIPPQLKAVLFEDLLWESIEWAPKYMQIGQAKFKVVRLYYLSRT